MPYPMRSMGIHPVKAIYFIYDFFDHIFVPCIFVFLKVYHTLLNCSTQKETMGSIFINQYQKEVISSSKGQPSGWPFSCHKREESEWLMKKNVAPAGRSAPYGPRRHR